MFYFLVVIVRVLHRLIISCVLDGDLPRVVRSDTGTDFFNAVVSSLFQLLGVHVKHGAVRHPQYRKVELSALTDRCSP